MKRLFSALFFTLSAGAAAACPDASAWGAQATYSGSDLYSPRALDVVAGGDRNLKKCAINWRNWNGRPSGHVTSAPDFSITVNNLGGYEIEFRVLSECDAVLAVNTAAGNWYFDDDDNGNIDPKIRFTNPAGGGIYDVWIGTYDGSLCNARLIIETF